MNRRAFLQFKAIYRKELLEALRDTVSLFFMIGLPLIFYPLIAVLGLLGYNQIADHAQSGTPAKIAVMGEIAPLMKAELEAQFELVPLEPSEDPCAQAQQALQAKTYAAIAAFDQPPCGLKPDAENDPYNNASPDESADERAPLGTLQIWFDGSRESSSEAARLLEEQANAGQRALTAQTLKDHQIDPQWSRPYAQVRVNLATPNRMTAFLLSKILPLVLVLLCALSGYYPAIDMLAGEQERGTLETLCATPCSRFTLLLAKYAAVVTLSLIATLANLLAIALTFAATAAQLPQILQNLSLPIGSLAVSGLLLLPTAFFVGALLMLVAVFARNLKEAQNLATPAFSLCVVPAGFALLPWVSLNAGTALVPGMNITLALQAALLNQLSPLMALEVFAVQALYAFLLVQGASRLFANEEILFGQGLDVKAWLRSLLHPRAQNAPLPPSAGVLLFLLILLLTIYVAPLIPVESEALQLCLAQVIVVLAPALLVLWFYRQPFKDLGFVRPGSRALLGSLITGVGIFGLTAFIATLTFMLFPQATEETAPLQESLNEIVSETPAIATLVVLAILPAVFEEFAFRGVILRAFSSLGFGKAALISSALFALLHLSPYRLLPTFLLALTAAFVFFHTRSLFCAMIIHALQNGLVTLTAYSEALHRLTTTNLYALFGLSTLFYVGIWIVRRSGKPEREETPEI